uniref:Uncharacterized protein n=1 Tax=Rhizophora mucronata TaxID=61149 RepID=A0A2P2QE78_RHIMU
MLSCSFTTISVLGQSYDLGVGCQDVNYSVYNIEITILFLGL